MKRTQRSFSIKVLFSLLFSLTQWLQAAPGDLDALNANVTGTFVKAAVSQADGKTLLVGNFTSVLGVSRNHIARLNADGTLDTSFDPKPSGPVSSAVVQPDGKILIAGLFATLQPNGAVSTTARQNIARLEATGELDMSFDPKANGLVSGALVQANGQILVWGEFTTLQPNGAASAATRNRIARLNADGSLDETFDPNSNGAVLSVVAHAAGFVIGGAFTNLQPNGAVTATTRNNVARLLTDGSLDSGFDPNANGAVNAIYVQADNNVVLGGAFSSVSSTTRNGLARVTSAGALETFDPNASGSVLSIIGQADGKLLVSGAFTTVASTARNRVARLLATGALDSTFNPNVTGGDVQGLSAQSDGQVFATGAFTQVGGTARGFLARLQNDTATQSLTVPTSARVQWLRGGASPEAARVIFEVSTNAGVTYTPHGLGTRITGGWEFVGSLPVSGQLRARAFCSGGAAAASTGIVQAETVFSGFAVPDIAVELTGTNIPDGGSVAYGAVASGSSADRTFTIKNEGTLDLTGLGITFSGVDPDRFSVITPPVAPVIPGGSTTFTVRFSPLNNGGHTATLQIASNDFDENPFDILLSDSAALSANANLSNLVLNTGPISPTFTSATTSYTATVPFATTSLTVTPTKVQSAAVIRVNGTLVASGAASSSILLNVGANVITTVVTAADGVTTNTYTVTVTRAGPAAGDLDLAFDPRMNSQTFSAVPQADGKILVTGYFGAFQPNGGATTIRNYLARLNADGTSDATFNANFASLNNIVYCVVPQANGQILVGGEFTVVGAVTRNRIFRLNANGTLDTTFNPNVDSSVFAIAQQPDGKILVGGRFQNVQPNGAPAPISRSRIARFNADGSLDASFNPNLNGDATCILPQADGKIYISGTFTSLQPNGAASATARVGIARLNSDGTLDSAFNANANHYTLSMAPQADGKLVVGGYFSSIGGQSRNRVARLDAAGLADSFNPNANSDVYTLAVQTDGKVLMGGNFSTLQPNGAAVATTRNRLARVNADGTLDTAFDPNFNNQVLGVALQSDGQILVAGSFSTVGAVSRSSLVRLGNDAVSQTLTVPSANRIEWLRSGALPEAGLVTFDASNDGGITFTRLGLGTRISGGWEYLPALGTLPASGIIRAQARSLGGYYTGSTSVTQAMVAYSGFDVPDIVVEQPVGTNINDGGSFAFGAVAPGSTADRTFTITNMGTVDLTGLGITFDGVDPERFSVITPPVALVTPGNSTTFTVRFAPMNGGGHTATMRIASNDFDENPFDIGLSDTNALSANPSLISLVPNSGVMVPTFSATTTTYTISVPYATTGITLTPTRLQSAATIQVNGVTTASGATSAVIPLTVGANVVNTVVTAADGTTTRTYAVTITRAGPVVGDVDLAFDPNVTSGSQMFCSAMQADGKMLVGGSIFAFQPNGAASATTRNYFARLNADGTLDTPNLNINGTVCSIVIQPDGKVLIGGDFTSVLGVTRNRVARLNADMTLDVNFNPNANGRVWVCATQPDGKTLIGGSFTTIQPPGTPSPVTRNRIARLNVDGSLDHSFDPNLNSEMYGMLPQADGKIMISGSFNSLQPNGAVSSTNRNYIARLNSDGTLDSTFNANANSYILCMAPQADGKILVGGYFSSIGGQNRGRIARLDAAGLADSFNPNANSDVYSIVTQTDGKVVLGGFFTTLQPNGAASPTPRNRLARVNADGTLDTVFDPNANGTVRGVTLQSDGQMVVYGDFTTMGAANRSRIARLGNDAATQSLTVPNAGRVQWLIGGASPEALATYFEVSIDAGVTYLPFGYGTRIAGGWECLSPLPSSGQVRARALNLGGNYNACAGITQAVTSFSGFLPADIVVERPDTTNIADGGTAVFGAVSQGSFADITFTLRNAGGINLTGLGITIDGVDASMFSVITPPIAPVVPGGNTTFTVRFAPTTPGGHTAALHIASNDFDENPFTINLSDTGAASSNANLSNLVLSTGVLSPAFTPATTSYVTDVFYGTTSLSVVPTRLQSGAVIRVNGNLVTSGAASAAIPVSVGANTITTVVTAADGVTTKTYTVTVNRAAAAAGDVDLTHDPRAWNGSNIYAYVPQPDGKILIGGYFFTLQPNGAASATTRNYLARINADGTLDTAFNPSIGGQVLTIALQSDGKILISGYFTSVAGQTRNRIARLNADGTLDATFNPNANDVVFSMLPLPDGKILIGGQFTTLQPNGAAIATPRNRIARLNADGTLDSSYDPNANSTVHSMALQPDGKLLIGGSFTTLQPNADASSTTRNRLARLNADGTLDTGFNPNINSTTLAVVVQPDNKIVIGGTFNVVNSTARNRMARLNADGTLDTGYNPNANSEVNSLALQSDGKIILGGFFTTLQPNGAATATTRNRIARVNTDGSLDTAFNPNANGTVRSVALQADGQILVGGDFTTMGAASRFHLARLQNDTATQLLTVPSATRVEWLRGGSLPEAASVTFEVSINGGANYVFLGYGSRIAGGWEYLPELGTLPANGQLRARARSAGGYYNGSSSLTEAIALFPSAFPEIAVEHPAGTDLVAGSASVSFGSLEMGSAGLTKTFTIKNSGAGNLGLSSVFVTGGDAADFSVSTFGMLSVVPSTNGSTTFTVTARPSALGARSTTLRITNNDTNESTFDIALTATGIASTNADLTSLSLSSGTLAPAFASNTTSYTAVVPNAVSSLTVTPVKSDANAVIRVNGSIVASGAASSSIPLNVGTNVLTTLVTAQNGTTTKTYTVTVTRTIAPTITSPTISAIAGSSVTLGGNVTSDGGAAITARGVVISLTSVNNNPTLGGGGVSNVPGVGTTGIFTVDVTGLSPGLNYSYKAYATNGDGTSYTSVGTFTTITSNADLSSLAISVGSLAPTFSSSTLSYTATVLVATTSVTVTPVKADAGATIQVQINGGGFASVNSGSASAALPLNQGDNDVEILVTAQDGTTTKFYTVTVTRPTLADYNVSTTGNAIVVTDISGNGETLTVSEPSAGNIQFAATGRTFSVNGGPNIAGNSGALSRASVSSITVNAAAGADSVNVGAFTGTLPSLTINGGTGDDTVNLNGDITFAADANLNLDLQNDDASPGVDSVIVSAGANLTASGAGSITVKVSRNISLANGSSFSSVDGGIILDAHSSGTLAAIFSGIDLAGVTISTSGEGNITLTGKGGLGASGTNRGVVIRAASVVSTSGSGSITINGTGGSGTNFIEGVGMDSSTISVVDGSLQITGTGGAGSGLYDSGVRNFGTQITSSGSGNILITGTAGSGSMENYGISMGGTGSSLISSGSGTITLQGTASSAGVTSGVQLGTFGQIAITSSGTGAMELIGDSMSFHATNAAINTGSNSIKIRQLTNGAAINLGAADAVGVLGLSDAELDRITAASLTIGDTNSGSVTISAVISPANYLTLDIFKGVTFASTGGFASDVTSAAVFEKILVNGAVAIHPSATLSVTAVGGFVPDLVDTFTVIENVSASSTSGSFSGKPEDALFLVGGVYKAITYIGGTGNDVVLINPPNAAPSITNHASAATAGLDVAENSTAVIDVDATDSDIPAQTLTFSLSGADVAKFSIDSSTGVLSFISAPDFETPTDADTDNVYEVTVTVTDDGAGLLTDSQALSVTVTNVNELPSFAKGADQLHQVQTKTLQTIPGWATTISDGDNGVQTLTFNVSVTAGGSLFTTAPAISSNGTLTYTPTGATGSATISVTLTDDASIQGLAALTTAAQTFTITVNEIASTGQWLDTADGLVGGGAIYRPIPGVINAAGQITFKAMGRVGTGTLTSGNDSLLMSDVSGSLRAIGQEATLAPDEGSLTGTFSNLVISAGGRSVISERLVNTTAAKDYAYLISEDGVTLEILSRESDVVTGGGVFTGHTGRHAADAMDRVYFPGTLSGVVATKNSGVWFDDADSLSNLALEGQNVGSLTGDLAWLGNVSLSLSAAGDGAAFTAALQNNPGNATQKTPVAKNAAIFSGAPGSLELVARKGDVVPGVGKLSSFSAVSRGAAGDHAFISLLALSTTAPVVAAANDQALFAEVGGSIHLVARENTTVLAPGLKPARFGSFYMTSTGAVIYQVWVTGTGVSVANDGLLCRWTVAGGNVVLAREGSVATGTGLNYGAFQVLSVSPGGAVLLQSTLSSGIVLMRAMPGAGLSLVVRTGTTLTFNGATRGILSLGINQTGAGTGGGGGGLGDAINDDGAVLTVLSLGGSDYTTRIFRP